MTKEENVSRFSWLGQGVRTALRRFLYVGVPTVLWIILGRYELINVNYWNAGFPVLGLISFALGLPLSIALRGDIFRLEYGIVNNQALLLLGLAVTLVNFLIFGLAADGIRALKKRLSKPSDD